MTLSSQLGDVPSSKPSDRVSDKEEGEDQHLRLSSELHRLPCPYHIPICPHVNATKHRDRQTPHTPFKICDSALDTTTEIRGCINCFVTPSKGEVTLWNPSIGVQQGKGSLSPFPIS